MAKVKVGDLVCMYRRKNKGLGLVLEQIDDIVSEMDAEVPVDVIIETMSTLKTYNDRHKYRSRQIASSHNPAAAKVFFEFNAQPWCRRPKYKFAKVRWFKKPSAYESSVRQDETWCPQDWLKRV